MVAEKGHSKLQFLNSILEFVISKVPFPNLLTVDHVNFYLAIAIIMLVLCPNAAT